LMSGYNIGLAALSSKLMLLVPACTPFGTSPATVLLRYHLGFRPIAFRFMPQNVVSTIFDVGLQHRLCCFVIRAGHYFVLWDRIKRMVLS
jgi:hypothetical protein